ncbi:MAG: DNA primase [Phycisphaerales bacterium]|nr:DNA primase [Phycisphaerales bacterium]
MRLTTTARQTDDRQRVLDATDISSLIGEHLSLRPKGRELVGLCPFHDDHTPSMCVIPHKQMYHCFSCGAGGNAITFVREYHKMGFREALEYLAHRANITLTPWRPGASAESADASRSARDEILSANLTAQAFFRVLLDHPEHGKSAREVIDRRLISPHMVDLFGLGVSPDRWDGLERTIAGKRLDPARFLRAGLLKKRDSAPGLYDAFRNRLMFPIQDQIGRVIGFGARRLNDEDEPKYLNSAESPVFDKSTTLYGLAQAAQSIRKSRSAIVTEGYMDAIACHQAGFTNAVATLGTAMTAGNARALRRLCETVILLFDGDEAGQKAAHRAVEVFFAEPIDVKIAILRPHTDAKDPDELLKRPGGPETFTAVLAAAIDPLTLLLAKVRSDLAGKGVSAQSRIAEEFLGRLADLGLGRVDHVRRELIVRRLAQMTGGHTETLQKFLVSKTSRQRPAAASTPSADASPAKPAYTLDERLLGCILCEPALATESEDVDLVLTGRLEAPSLREVAAAVESLVMAGTPPHLSRVLAALDDSSAQQAAAQLAREIECFAGDKPDRVRELWIGWTSDHRRESALREAGIGPEFEGAAVQPFSSDPWAAALSGLTTLREVRASIGDLPDQMPRPLSA